MSMRSREAFTMIELIVVIVIIAVIAAVIFLAVNPAKRIGDAQNAIRDQNVLEITHGLERLIADSVYIPAELGDLFLDTEYMLVTAGGDTDGTCSCPTLNDNIARVDLAGTLSAYLPSLPVDEDASGDDTGYYIKKTSNNLFSINHCYEYGNNVATVSVPVAAVAGPNSPQLGANYGSGVWSWSFPTRVYANDTNYATLGTMDDTPIESDMNIVKADATLGTTNKASLATWRSTPEPDYMGDDWATVANPGYTTYGGEGDLWGETWTAADINDADFGVAFRLKKVSTGQYTTYMKVTNFGFAIPTDATITGIQMDMERWVYNPSNYEPYEYVDHVRMIVYYEE